MAKLISELVDGERISGQYLVGNVSKGVNNFGANYMTIELRDMSGAITGKKWDSTTEDENIFVIGNVVYIEGETLKYKDALQLKILSVKALPIEDIDVAKFIKAPPIPKEELVKRFYQHVDNVKNEDCNKILHYMIDKLSPKLFDYPAAVSIHHEYASGLMMHTVSMADVASFFADYYPDVNKDILITGVLLHDMAKTIEYEGPVIYHYSLEGKLIGHISIMCSEIRNAAEKLSIKSEVPLLLEHMVLSHHGSLEFGSPILPLTKEALLLSMVDNLDSKMVVVSKALDGVKEGEFTQRIISLDNRMFYKPKN